MLERVLGRGLRAKLRASSEIAPAVADAMIRVQRHRFVRRRDLWRAYQDASLPTGSHTSISQPTFIAKVLTAGQVAASDRVLEIGTGSGYTAAVLAQLASEVVTIERISALATRAKRRLRGEPRIHVIVGDAWHAPELAGTFDTIYVMCGVRAVPDELLQRLRDRGRLLVPIGTPAGHAICGHVVRVVRDGDAFEHETLFPSEWNPLIGR